MSFVTRVGGAHEPTPTNRARSAVRAPAGFSSAAAGTDALGDRPGARVTLGGKNRTARDGVTR